MSGSSLVDVILTQKGGEFHINLINMAGSHNVSGVRTFGEIPVLGPLTVTFPCESDCDIYLEPGHVKADYDYQDGKAAVMIERLTVHMVIVVK